jgi:guanine deaminase
MDHLTTIGTCVASYLLYKRIHSTCSINPYNGSDSSRRLLLLANLSIEILQRVRTIYHGPIIHSLTFDKLEVIQECLLCVDANGKICALVDVTAAAAATAATTSTAATTAATISPTKLQQLEKIATAIEWITLGTKFLCPGFVDAHAHAPQHAFTGTGMDLPLLEWLQRYTFPHESKFSNLDHARNIYDNAVRSHLRNGSTTVSYFATIHTDACKVLVNVVRDRGQRALVGKVNMDRNAPDFYIETTEGSLRDTQTFVNYVLNLHDPLVTPVITPRFVPTCTPTLMKGLGVIAKNHNLPIQSHMGETLEEYAWVRSLHPESTTYTDVYRNHGLLPSDGTVYMAHCIHCGSGERESMLKYGCGVVHCPNSNFTLGSGICNVQQWVGEGHVVGLGTDVAGGYSPSMLDAIRNARIASVAVTQVSGKQNSKVVQDFRLSFSQLFYLATLGGARVVGMGNVIGNFEVGKDLDALVVDPEAIESPMTVYKHDDLLDRFQKFLFLGDDRNIIQVIVKGDICKTK